MLLALALLLAAVDILVASAQDSRVWRPLVDPGDLEPTEVRLEKFVGSLLEERRRSLLTGDPGPLESFYEISTTGGLFGWENERRRVSYLGRWAEARGIRILGAEGFVEIDHIAPEEPDGARYWLEITEHVRFTYAYSPDSPLLAIARKGEIGDGLSLHAGRQEVRFGSRSVQVLEVVRSGESWKIVTNWYCDPLGTYWDPPTVPLLHDEDPPEAEKQTPSPTRSGTSLYDRAKAADYAVRHSGVRSLEGGGRYNLDYRIYSFPGGDCANFASQVLAAGGIPEGGGWRYDRTRGEGSTSWVRSENLVWHLIASGTGRCTFRGRFSDLFERDEDGTIRFASVRTLLAEGDVVAYEKGGEITHVAVVVGFDPLGYPLVASHTADRLFFPVDLGWTDSTIMWFIHIVY